MRLRIYASKNVGEYPSNIAAETMAAYGISGSLLTYQDPNSGELKEWKSFPGRRDSDLDAVIVASRAYRGKVLVMFASGGIEIIRQVDFEGLVTGGTKLDSNRISSSEVRKKVAEMLESGPIPEGLRLKNEED